MAPRVSPLDAPQRLGRVHNPRYLCHLFRHLSAQIRRAAAVSTKHASEKVPTVRPPDRWQEEGSQRDYL